MKYKHGCLTSPNADTVIPLKNSYIKIIIKLVNKIHIKSIFVFSLWSRTNAAAVCRYLWIIYNLEWITDNIFWFFLPRLYYHEYDLM